MEVYLLTHTIKTKGYFTRKKNNLRILKLDTHFPVH